MKFEKLKNIVEVKKGKKSSFVETPDENSVRVLQIDDLRNDTNPKFTNDKNGVLVQEDDILIAWDGANAGTIGYGKSGYIGSTIALLRKKQPELYSTTFIGIFLQSQYQYLRSKTTGATIPHISRKALDDLEVPVISVNDQLHIANLLSKAENLIAQRKESIRLLDEFLKSTFLEMFGSMNEKDFPLERLDDVSTKINDGEHGSVEKKERGILYLMARNITHNNTMDFKEISYVSKEAHDKMYKRCNPEAGDILIVCVGATIGKVAIVPIMEEFSIARSVALVKPNYKHVNSQYLLGFFNSEYAKRQIKKSSLAAAQAGLYIGKIKEIKIPIPPISLQTQFAQIVEKTEALKSQYQQSLAELENLYGSLSQKAFKGELKMKQNV